MIWSDNAHKVIAAARFNGSGLVVLVNSKINVTGEVAWFACLFVQTYSNSIRNRLFFQGYTHTHTYVIFLGG